jgi:hypothetical protein
MLLLVCSGVPTELQPLVNVGRASVLEEHRCWKSIDVGRASVMREPQMIHRSHQSAPHTLAARNRVRPTRSQPEFDPHAYSQNGVVLVRVTQARHRLLPIRAEQGHLADKVVCARITVRFTSH